MGIFASGIFESALFSGMAGARQFYDSFTDTNGVDLRDHTPDIDSGGLGWVRGSAASSTVPLQILSNKAAGAGVQNPGYLADVGLSDCKVSGLVSLPDNNGNRFGLLARNGGLGAYQSFEGSALSVTGRADLFEDTTIRATQTGLGATGWTSVPFEITLSGTSVTFSSASVKVFSLNYITANYQSNTKHGIGCKQTPSTAHTVDDFRIQQL